MKTNLRVTGCILAIRFCALGLGGQQPSPQQIPPCVVTVTSYDQGGSVFRQGVGWFVSDSGSVIAPPKLIEGAYRVEITAEGKRYPLSSLDARDIESGLVLFTVAMPARTARPPRVGRSIPNVGQQIQAVVLSERSEPSIIIATVKDITRVGTWESFSVEGTLPGPSLGYPVFSLDGDFVGIIGYQPPNPSSFVVHSGERITKAIEQLVAAGASDSGDSVGKAGTAGAPPGPLSTTRIPQIGGVLQGKAKSQVAPEYPRVAKEYHITGTVIVEITIDETGHVIGARAIGGHFQRPKNVSEDQARQIIPEFHKVSVEAARKWKFEPTRLSGVPVKVIGTVTFNFAM